MQKVNYSFIKRLYFNVVVKLSCLLSRAEMIIYHLVQKGIDIKVATSNFSWRVYQLPMSLAFLFEIEIFFIKRSSNSGIETSPQMPLTVKGGVVPPFYIL